jgi:hypothetical protein
VTPRIPLITSGLSKLTPSQNGDDERGTCNRHLLCTHPRVEETLDSHGPPLSLWPLPRLVLSGDDEQNLTA